MSLQVLAEATNRTIGTKQTVKAVQAGIASLVFIAEDADAHVTGPLAELCGEKDIPIIKVETMAELGEACGIDVGAASAAVIGQ